MRTIDSEREDISYQSAQKEAGARTYEPALSVIDKFNIDVPWSPKLFYYSVRGAENFHIYLWILKDIGTRFTIHNHWRFSLI